MHTAAIASYDICYGFIDVALCCGEFCAQGDCSIKVSILTQAYGSSEKWVGGIA